MPSKVVAYNIGVSTSPDVTIIWNDQVIKKPTEQFIVELFNEIQELRLRIEKLEEPNVSGN